MANKKSNRVSRKEKKRHILDIATAVFSERGYEGARIEEIASRAGISKWNMYYYAGDKETLYAEVLNNLLTDIMKGIVIDFKSGKSPEELMKIFIRGVARGASYIPLHSIVLREMLSGGKYLPENMVKAVGRAVSVCKRILIMGRNQGIFKETNPFIIFMLLFGTMNYYQIVVPYVHKVGSQLQYTKKLGQTVNEKVIEEIEKVIFDHIRVSK